MSPAHKTMWRNLKSVVRLWEKRCTLKPCVMIPWIRSIQNRRMDPQRQAEVSGGGGGGGKWGDAHGARVSFPRDGRVLSLLVVMATQL